ncbi:MAG TPA: tetratricopeptide repeat protein [Candidatus Dormibacteraeota bacterium]|nr:tetratricopeptide repeat protein [Candidatus Dormibacteraeota bacterium]
MPWRIFRIGLFMTCVGLFAPALFAQAGASSQFASGESHPETLLVFPFENASRNASLDWLGDALSELTIERLQDRGVPMLTRQDRLATLEKMGLPDSARFSHATIIKIAIEADADAVVYGQYASDGKTVTMQAWVLRISPPSLSPPMKQTSTMQDLLRAQARLTWQIVCTVDPGRCPAQGANRDETSFSDPPPSLRMDALKDFVQGLTGSDDETRLPLLREASRLEPAWDRPPFELGLIYFGRHDCESALPWFSRVPPNRPNGPEASFDAGVCHLLRNDPARAEAAFSGLTARARSTDPQVRIPELPEAHNNLGVSRLRLGNWNAAVTEFERAAALDPDERDYLVNLGIARLSGKQTAAAVTAFERARKLDPDDKDTSALLISALESMGRNTDAAAVRDDAGEIGGHPVGAITQAVLQDPVALARMARVSEHFDRTLLRTNGEDAAARPRSASPRSAPPPRARDSMGDPK